MSFGAPPLTRAQRLQLASQPVFQPIMLVGPTKGWNTRDALDTMDPQEAVTLDNFYADYGGLKIRNGYAPWVMGLPGPVRTLSEFDAGPVRTFIAAAGGGLYDVSAAGDPPVQLASGFTSDTWNTELFLSRLFLCNGADPVQVYDGATVAAAGFTGLPEGTLLAGVRQYQQRLFFWAQQSTGFWYAELNSISGPLTFYDLAAWAPAGGNIVTITSFSHDGGAGVADMIVFAMSGGDHLVFLGNDPSNINFWALQARYRLSPPVAARAVCRYGAEAFMTTADDHVPLQAQLVALKLGQLPPRSKVSSAVQAAVGAMPGANGWQALYYPRGRRLIFNVPNPDGTFDQHVQNTGSTPDLPWMRFRGMPAECWALYRDALYFGATDGTVYQADIGTLDNGQPIQAIAQQAWNDLNSPQRKRVSATRPLIQTTGGAMNLTLRLGFDYGPLQAPVLIAVQTTGSPWDTSPWDTSPWSSESTVTTQWHVGGGSGVAVSVGLAVASSTGATWMRTDLKGEIGQAL